jgi:alpha-mannosidase
MWSWQETVALTLDTFRTMLDLMDEYPDFHYSQSQASVYKIVGEYDPPMMGRIKERIKEGRWEVTAAAWVETDKNMPNTESLVRHIQYTKKYLNEVWGVDKDSLELDFSPDTFGHSRNLPEIARHGGLKYYYHCRGNSDNFDLTHPVSLYRWRGPNGAELLCYREPYWYNSGISPRIGLGLIGLTKTYGGLKTGLIVYGVGNHGGGPTRRDIETAIDMASWPIFPHIEFGTFRRFFKEAEKYRDAFPILDRELNFMLTGCYTTQSRIKVAKRTVYPFPRYIDRFMRAGGAGTRRGTVFARFSRRDYPTRQRNARGRRSYRHILCC